MKFFAALIFSFGLAHASIQTSKNQLLIAIESDIVKLAKKALKNSSINADFYLDNEGSTALMLCAEKGSTKVFEYLVETAHASINATNVQRYTALHYAAGSNGSFTGLQACISVPGVNLNATESAQLNTPMHFAAAAGNFDKTMALIDAGAELEPVNGILNTPLLAACSSGNFMLVKEMISRGADHLNVNKYNMDCLALATRNGRFELVKFLLDLINPTKLNYNTGIIRALTYAQGDPDMLALVSEYFPGTFSFMPPPQEKASETNRHTSASSSNPRTRESKSDSTI